MKKVCFLIGNLDNSGGTERVCSIIANELSNAGHDVTLLSIKGGMKPFFTLEKDIKIKSLFPSMKRSIYLIPSIIYKLRKQLKKEQIDTLIVVETMSVIFTLPAIQGLSIKHICWEHFNFNVDLGKYGRRLARQLAARHCDIIVTLTEKDKKYWLQGTNHKSQIISIPNPSPFPPQKYIKRDNSKIVLAVGRLTHQKGFDLLIKAWVNVANLNPEWRLLIVGEGEDKQQLTTLINHYNLNNSINLVGQSNTIEKFYKDAEIFCLSSRYEGFPMVLLETLSFGLPVVSFDCEFGPSEILSDTESIIVPPNNVDLLADALNYLINNYEKRQVISFKSIAKSRIYQPSNIVNQWLNII